MLDCPTLDQVRASNLATGTKWLQEWLPEAETKMGLVARSKGQVWPQPVSSHLVQGGAVEQGR